jgi:FkbM family methyltransferase
MAEHDTDTSELTFLRRLVAELGRLLDVMSIADRGHRLRVLWIWLVLVVKRRLGIRAELGLRLRWRGPRSIVEAVISDASELRVIREVFVNGEYDLPPISPSVILDVGSNVGLSVLYFHDRYPEAKIIAVEPARRGFARLERNVGDLPNVHLIRAAAVGADGPVKLHSGWQSWASSLFAADDMYEVEEVEGRTLDGILAAYGEERADVIKLDIEGAEPEVLVGSATVQNAECVVFEFHQEHCDDDVWTLSRAVPGLEVVRMVGHSAQHPLVTLARRA